MTNNIKEASSIKRPFLTMDEAANYLGISKATLYRYTCDNVLAYFKVRNRKNYFLKSDLDDFVLNSKNRCKSQSEIESEAATKILKEDMKREK